MPDPPHSLYSLLRRWCSQMLDPWHSLHLPLWRWWTHMLAIRISSFMLLRGRTPIAPSPTCVSVRGDSRYPACPKPPGKIGRDGFNFCRMPCSRLPHLLTSWALVCSVRCRFIAASLVSGPARFRVGTVPWLCALSTLNTSIRIRVCTASCSVNESWSPRTRQPDSMTSRRGAGIKLYHGRAG